ncbi:MAG TPA: nucleotidyltransferase domain-containing protein [Ktedonobacterales bacterium]|nr:nucleotidyltransferase domain-containing protein [Ktedonobacterales bacterium]
MASDPRLGDNIEHRSEQNDSPLLDEEMQLISWLDPGTAACLRRVTANVARQAPHALAVILFGSVARHEERPLSDRHPSDVDVLALFTPVEDQDAITSEQHAALSWAVVYAYEAFPDAMRDVQVLGALTHFQHWDESFVENVARDGILLWARGPLPAALRPVEERRSQIAVG